MTLRLIEVVTTREVSDELENAIHSAEIADSWKHQDEKTQQTFLSILVPSEHSQHVLEILQAHLGADDQTRIVILAAEATLPKFEKAVSSSTEKPKEEEQKKKATLIQGVSREEIYHAVEDTAKLTGNFILLVILSTLVATIGIIENSLPVLIGSMLIAPLLGPNLALALGTTLGDLKLIWNAVKTNVAGIITCVLFAFLTGVLLHRVFHIPLTIAHVKVGYDSIVLALASGAAAVLSLISGVPGSLVGVMVAVALLPPTVMIGIALSVHQIPQAINSMLLLAINIVCINLSAKIVFLIKGIRPSLWYEQQRAEKTTFYLILFWAITLVFLGIALYGAFEI